MSVSCMMLGHGTSAKPILSPASIARMTRDHLSATQRPAWELNGEYFETHGFGICMSVVTRTGEHSGSVGTFGWDRGYGTTWYCDPREDMVSIRMTQAMWTSPTPPPVSRDFRALACLAIH